MLPAQIFGFVLFVAGVAIVGWNFYVDVLANSASRCVLFWGSLILWLSALLLMAHPAFMWAALVISLFDVSGPVWFAAVLLWNWIAGSNID